MTHGTEAPDLFSPYHDGSMQHDKDGGWVSIDDYNALSDAKDARIAELKAVIKAYLEAAADVAGGAPDKYAEERRAFLALRCAVNWPTKASCSELTTKPTERETP